MDVEKTVQFMLENQARFDTRLGELAEVQSRHQQMIGQLAEVVRELAAVQQRAGERFEEERQRAGHAEQMLREDLSQVSADVKALVKLFDQFIRGDGR
jgi:hypothetical protein